MAFHLPFDMVDDVPDEVRELVGEINNALCDWVLEVLAAKGYEARDVRRGDTYFVFSGYECSVVSFRLSRVWPGWKFGLWLRGEDVIGDAEDDAKVIQLFCQHETAIDKFKPSASDLTVDIERHELLSMLEDGPITRFDGVVIRPWPERHVQALADQVRMHPFLSYEGIKSWSPIDYRPVPRTIRYMVSERKREVEKRVSCEILRRWAGWMVKKTSEKPYVRHCELIDYGEHTYPRLEVFCELVDDPSDEALDEMWGLWRLDDGTDKKFVRTELRVSIYYVAEGKKCQLY